MKGFYKSKKLQLQSTSYLQNMHFPTHDYPSQQQQSNHSSLSDDQDTLLSDYEDSEDLNENIVVSLPHISKSLKLISSFSNNHQLNLIKSIDQNKKKYFQLLKKKEQNRQKFILKINNNLTDSQSFFFSSKNSIKNSKGQNQTKIPKIKNENLNKICRSQTQQNKSKRKQTIKDSESNWDTNSQIDFNLTSQRQQSTQKSRQKQGKKKITIKRKASVNSSVKAKNEQKEKVNQQNSEKEKKDSTLNKSVNEFMFLEQYQKDNKQIMNRMLTIIEQDHLNRLASGPINQSIVGQSQNQWERVNKMKQIYNRSGKLNINQINTEYSSVKPIVINNYIKSPTQFMGKTLIQREMAIRMLQQKRHNKNSMLNSVSDSRILQQSTILALPSRQLSRQKNQSTQQQPSQQQNSKKTTLKSKPLQQQMTSKQQIQSSLNTKDQNQLDFQLLYQKLKNQVQMEKNNYKHQTVLQRIPQSFSHETEKSSEMLPINSARPSQSQANEQIPSSFMTNQKTFATHNVSQNLNQFNINTSVQSAQTESIFNFKKPSVSMEIPFGNQNKPNESISLAEAFKKKFGAGKFGTKDKTVSQKCKKQMKQGEPLSQLKGYQNKVHQEKSKDMGHFSKKQIPQARKTLKISKKGKQIGNKQNLNCLQTPRSQSSHFNSNQQSLMGKLSKQPSKQLLDRLIYGQKAAMSKKEMYELSKKNYMKLPEIEEKRRQEERRLKQLQKKEKIKQYQKKIRTSKNSISRDSVRTSLESSVLKQV